VLHTSVKEEIEALMLYMKVTCSSIKGSCVQCHLPQAGLVFLTGSSRVELDSRRVNFF
jgi:hypothetical protein